MGFFSNIKELGKEQKRAREELQEKFKQGGKPLGIASCKYLGGHPAIIGEKDGLIQVNKAGIIFEPGLTLETLYIPIENIIRGEFKTDEQITKDVTLTRLLAFGVFAFGMKKKRKEITNYVVLTYTENEIENTILFQTKTAGAFASSIMKARQEYATEHPQAGQNNNVTADIPSQIKKLSELREQGILTEEEFNNKKKELLSKM